MAAADVAAAPAAAMATKATAEIAAVDARLRQEDEEETEEEDRSSEALLSTQHRLDNLLHNKERRGVAGNASHLFPSLVLGAGKRSSPKLGLAHG